MGKTLNKKQISILLDIKGKLLMLDKLLYSKNVNRCDSEKKIKKSDWFFKEHLTKSPNMPGILITESMLQSSICLLKKDKKNKNLIYLITKKNVNFYNEIKKFNGNLNIETKIVSKKIGLYQVISKCFFKKKRIASGNFFFVKKN